MLISVGRRLRGREFDGDFNPADVQRISTVDPGPPLRHQLHILAVAAPLLFPGNHTNVYQAPHLNFYVGPRLTSGTPPQTRSVIGNLPNLRLLQSIMSVNE